MFLRFPGQWEEEAWAGGGEGLYYNVHRWYEVGVGRYASPEPEGVLAYFTMPPKRGLIEEVLRTLAPHPVSLGQLNLMYAYSDQSPLVFSDPTGEGILQWLKCAYYSRRCLNSAFRCRDYWRDWFRQCFANEDYEKIQENLIRARVATDGQFIYKTCFRDNADCTEASKICSKPLVFKP